MPLTIGQVIVVMSFVVLLLWIPLREVPGLGTISNALVIGVALDATLALLDAPGALWLRTALLAGGVLLNGLATALYIGSQFGRGPRDGLMTGLHRRTGRSLRLVRTGLEVTVVLLGLLLGGVAGLGTVALRAGHRPAHPGPAAALHRPAHPSVPAPRTPLTRQFLRPKSRRPDAPAARRTMTGRWVMRRHHPQHRR